MHYYNIYSPAYDWTYYLTFFIFSFHTHLLYTSVHVAIPRRGTFKRLSHESIKNLSNNIFVLRFLWNFELSRLCNIQVLTI